MLGVMLSGVMLAGCSTVPFEGYQPDGRYCFRIAKRKVCTDKTAPTMLQETEAKRFQPDPLRHTVWIVRNTRHDPYGKVSVRIGTELIDMLSETTARFALPPGPQHLTATAYSRSAGELNIVGRAGEQTFVEIRADVGFFFTDYSLRILPEQEGHRLVTASKLIADRR
ncbi:MAG: hypothetical protein JNN20_03445 [Betaproteobacteria bacterium]|nr:hypothetical protein [Betaproteobacteria bacterium]